MIPCGTGYAEPMNSKGFRYAIADLPTTHPDGADRTFDDDELFRIRDVLSRYDGWAVVMREDDAGLMLHAGATQLLRWEHPLRPGGKWTITEVVAIRRPALVIPLDGATSSVVTVDRSAPYAGGKPEWWSRWVLAHFGFRPGVDVVDVVLGSPTLVHAADGRISFDSLEQAA
ncbi:hypothetical protein JCM13591A_20170 [Microbacterium xylanilyticum]